MVPASKKKDPTEEFKRLLNIMDTLRQECPWDREQTFESLRKLTIEETYELAEAIIEKDMKAISGELGDLMLHIVFYAKIGSETGDFTMYNVLHGICEKLIYRHPHIYGDVAVNNASEVKHNWENLKLKEGRNGVLEGVPKGLPALIKANRIQEKVHGVGFDWQKRSQIWDKLTEEVDELKEAIHQANLKKTNSPTPEVEEEFGDLLFTVINAARLYGIEPENALEKTNVKFIRRFQTLEKKAREQNRPLQSMNLEEMNNLWEEAKNKEAD